jgi:uncharacterized protein YbjT (DUF2867 family)
MRILVTGASGFAGSLLVGRLLRDGHTVRALGRDPARISAALAQVSASRRPFADNASDLTGEVEVLRGDAVSGEGLATALAGVDVAYYLIHSMERPPSGSDRTDGRTIPGGRASPFSERDLLAARNFADSCARAGIARIVYLGGLLPRDRVASPHLASRESVERVLLDAVPDSLALRASIVIGARSRSFRFLVRLVERLPVLTLPAWRSFRTQPIDERDVIEMLAAAATVTTLPVPDRSPDSDVSLTGRSLDIGGPDILSYEEMIARIAESMLVRRPVLGLGVNFTPVAARVAAAIASEDPDLILPLMESLAGDLLPGGDSDSSGTAATAAAELLGVHLHSFDSAVEHALRMWEESEPLSAR